MKVTNARFRAVLGEAVLELNQMLPSGRHLGTTIPEDLDSFSLVNLMIIIEDRLQERYGVKVALTPESLISLLRGDDA